MTTKTIGIYSAPAAIRLPELASERRTSSSRPTLVSVDFNDALPEQGLPKRYEDTRQFAVQDCTHHRILKVGHDVHHRLTEEARSEQEEAVAQRERAIRDECEGSTRLRLRELEHQLHMQHEFKMSRLQQEHERAVQEAVLEAETAMRKELLEAVEREREEAKRKLREKEEELTLWWTEEAERRVGEAREEERAIAEKQRRQLQQQHEQQQQQLLQVQQRLREEAVQKMAEAKDQEMMRELMRARQEHQLIRQRESEQHAAQVQELKAEMAQREAELQSELEAAEAAHAATGEKQAAAEEELLRVYTEFETFIDRVLRLNTGGSGSFLLPYTEFLQTVANNNSRSDEDFNEEEEEEAKEQRQKQRPGSAGTVRLQLAQLPSNVQLVTEFC